MSPMPMWKSLLFAPADNLSLREKARNGAADAIILDLEDSVAATGKALARTHLRAGITATRDQGRGACVRINAGWRSAMADLEASICPGLQAIIVPKVEDAARLHALGSMLGEFEASAGLPEGAIGLIALIESVAALPALYEIAAAPRMMGLALGSEDYSLSLGVAPTTEALITPSRLIAAAAASRELMALTAPISIAQFRDMDAYSAALAAAACHGANGALCIHPRQVDVANSVFMPSALELEEAAAMIHAWDAAQAAGKSVAALEGAMIDLPVVERARRTLAKANRPA